MEHHSMVIVLEWITLTSKWERVIIFKPFIFDPKIVTSMYAVETLESFDQPLEIEPQFKM